MCIRDSLNWLALRLLRPGGLLVTFSCSGLVSADLFQKVVFGAAVDARRDVQILQHLGQSTDHPVPVSYTHLRAHETVLDLVCRLLLEKKKYPTTNNSSSSANILELI